MASLTPSLRAMFCVSMFVLCAMSVTPLHAQSVSPASADLESPSVGESDSVSFRIDDLDVEPDVYLCVPSCASDLEAPYIIGPDSLLDGESEWSLGALGCEFEPTYSCDFTVAYLAGNELPSKAELYITGGSYDTESSEGDTSFDIYVPLTGRVREQPVPGTLRFAQDEYSVDEGDTVEVMVQRVGGSDGELSVRWAVAEGGTASTSDYSIAGDTGENLSWGDGNTEPHVISVAATADNTEESSETFKIILESDDDCCGAASDSTDVTIVDSPPPMEPGIVQFELANYSVDENAGTIELMLTRTGGSDGVVTVDYRLVDGTATFAADYGDREEGTGGRVVWGDRDAAPKSIVIPIAEDLEQETPAETFSVTLSLPSSDSDDSSPRATLGDIDSTTVSIVDTSSPPDTVALASATYTVEESVGTLAIVVRRLGDGAGGASVGYRVVAGSATASLDFETDASSGRISWQPGQTADRVVPVRILEDALVEQDETFTLVLSEPANATLGDTDTTEITITDNDPPGVLGFDPARYAVAEDEGSVVLTVSRVDGSAGPATVNWTATDRTALAGEDYAQGSAARTGTLRWAAGNSTARTITLDIAEDSVRESEESFVVTLSDPSGAALGASDVATVLIGDITVTELDRLRFAAAASEIDEDSGNIRLVVQRDGDGAGVASVRYVLSDGTASTAADLAAATPTEGTIAWDAGDTDDRVIGLALANDALVEDDERFTVTLSQPSGAVLGSPASHEVTIVDDDEPPERVAGTVGFTAETLVVNESAGVVVVEIARVGGSDGALSVRYETVDAGAVAGMDYTAAIGTLSWPDGDASSRNITIDIATDAIVEEDERFLLQFRDAMALGEPLTLETTDISVMISDTTRVGTLVLLDPSPSALESDGAVVVRVSRTAGSDGVMQARYETVAESATADDDFTPGAGVLEWADGEAGVREVRVPIVDDTDEEANETFLIRFPDNASLGGDTRATIIDDDENVFRDVPALAELGSLRLVITSGDAQSGQPGSILEPMFADVIDEASNNARRADIPVRWRVNPAGSAELLEGARTVSDEAGGVRNRVRVLSRGFVNVIATIDVAGSSNGDATPPASEPSAAPGEAVFVVRAGLAVASGLNGNQAETGRAIESACDALGPLIEDGEEVSAAQLDLFDTCGELDARLADGRLPTALDRLAPEELFAIADSVIDTTDIQVTNIYARINVIRGELGRGRTDALDLAGLGFNVYGERIPGVVIDAAKSAWGGSGAAADAEGFGSRLGVFVNGSVSYGEVDSDGNQADADVRTRGLTLGADYRFSENIVAGVGLGVVVNETDFVGDGGSADLDGVNLTLFGTWYEADSGYLDGVLDVGRNSYDVRRRINLPGLADQFGVGKTDADVLSLTFSAGKDITLGAWELGPYTRLSHIRSTVDGYSEQASGDAAGFGSVLDIQGHDIRSTRIAFGGQVSRTIGTRRGVLVPQLRIETEIENEDRKEGIVASFQHDPSRTPFTVEGDAFDNGYVNLGLGASGVFANGRSGFLFYETRLAHRYITQHWLKAGIRLEF